MRWLKSEYEMTEEELKGAKHEKSFMISTGIVILVVIFIVAIICIFTKSLYNFLDICIGLCLLYLVPITIEIIATAPRICKPIVIIIVATVAVLLLLTMVKSLRFPDGDPRDEDEYEEEMNEEEKKYYDLGYEHGWEDGYFDGIEIAEDE